jgi:spermidine synthase
MAHLPLALLQHKPKDALDICLGMGTTYRSLSTWGIHVTAVELLPSVVRSFSYYHPEDPNPDLPNAHVVIDDGRLFLERTRENYDVITIDPPPPLKAPASSLLYSKDFYAVLKNHLRPGGMLQQWVPLTDSADDKAEVSILRAAVESFSYVRIFGSLEGSGIHILASDAPILLSSPSALAFRLPGAARQDFVAWGPASSAADQFAKLMANERPIAPILRMYPEAFTLDDDHPVNEYCLLHRIHLYKRTLTPISSFLDLFTH